LKKMLAETEIDYCNYDFTQLYGMRRGGSFALNCFCRWINGSVFYGLIYHLLVRTNEIKKPTKLKSPYKENNCMRSKNYYLAKSNFLSGIGMAERIFYMSQWFSTHKMSFIGRMIKFINAIIFRVHIDTSARIGKRLLLPHGGQGTVIGWAEIGDDAIIFHNVTIGSRKPGKIIIGNRVRIGAGAIILGPIRIGDDVQIAAGAIVVDDVPDFASVIPEKSRIVLKNIDT
jgi:Serine acetyltransferase